MPCPYDLKSLAVCATWHLPAVDTDPEYPSGKTVNAPVMRTPESRRSHQHPSSCVDATIAHC